MPALLQTEVGPFTKILSDLKVPSPILFPPRLLVIPPTPCVPFYSPSIHAVIYELATSPSLY